MVASELDVSLNACGKYGESGALRYVKARRQYADDNAVGGLLHGPLNRPRQLEPGWIVGTTNSGPHSFGRELPQPRMQLPFRATRPLRKRHVEVAYMALSHDPSEDPNGKIMVQSAMSWHASRERRAELARFIPLLHSE